jgi:hypothetical protein
MEPTRPRDHRKILETTVAQARTAAEAGAAKALQALAVAATDAPVHVADARKSFACACVRMAGRWAMTFSPRPPGPGERANQPIFLS